MSRKRENRSDWQPGGNQYSRKAGVPENPLYPPHKESNVAGVLLAIGAVIVALVCLAQIVTHFNYSARPYRQYVSQTGAGQTLAEDPGLAEAAGDQAVDYEEIFADGSGNGSGAEVCVTDRNTEDLYHTETQLESAAFHEGIHNYDVFVSDSTWTEASRACENLGGHLATIDSREEWDYLIDMLKSRNTGAYYFYIGASRTGNSDYYWEGADGSYYGDPVNSTSFWGNDLWLEGEPSYQDGDTREDRLAILYMKSSDRWVLNDVADDPIYMEEYLSGKVAYICEYE